MKQDVEVLTDDLDPSIISHKPTKETITEIAFSLDGVGYLIHANAKHETALRAVFAPYVEKARRVASVNGSRNRTLELTRTRANGSSANGHRPAGKTADIRIWARDHGWPDLKDKGRIPAEIQDQYHAATHS